MKPALTAEEWKDAQRSGAVDPNEDIHARQGRGDEWYGSAHFLAARMLYGQPFGFTVTQLNWLREEADVLQQNGAGAGALMCKEIADLIEALLPQP